jgi:hypothetical protein
VAAKNKIGWEFGRAASRAAPEDGKKYDRDLRLTSLADFEAAQQCCPAKDDDEG